jgi:hypothetical protein
MCAPSTSASVMMMIVVAQLRDSRSVFDARAEGGDHRADFLVGEDLVEACLLDVDDLAADREDRLEVTVASLLGGAAGRVALDQEELGALAFLGAVGELAGQAAAFHRGLAHDLARLAGGYARGGGKDGLLDDAPWRPSGSPRGTR